MARFTVAVPLEHKIRSIFEIESLLRTPLNLLPLIRATLNQSVWEEVLGIDTNTGDPARNHRFEPRSKYGDEIFYAMSPYMRIAEYLLQIKVSPSDVFMDVGCGLGRVACLAATLPFKRVIGLELDHSRASLARINFDQLRYKLAPLEVMVADILDAHAQAAINESTVFYLYDPFGRTTLTEFARLIEQSKQSFPRRIQIIFVPGESVFGLEKLKVFERQLSRLSIRNGGRFYHLTSIA